MRQSGNIYLRFIVGWLLLLVSVSAGANRAIETYVNNGDYDKAYNLLLDEINKHPDDAETIYLLGICSPSGHRSSLYLKDYLQKFPDGKHVGEAFGLLIDYYSSSGLLITAGSIFESTDSDKFSSPLNLYKAALYKQQLGEYDKAIEIYKEAEKTDDPMIKSWAELGICDSYLSWGNYNTALAGYKRLVDDYRDSPIFPFALVGISETYRRQGDMDKSRTFYELYRERYEESPRVIEIEASLIDNQTSQNDRRLNAVLDVDYYIQVGVFARESNAETCLRRFRNLRYKTGIVDFRDGGKTFHRVIVGPYGSESEARDVKNELERSQGEKYSLFIQ